MTKFRKIFQGNISKQVAVYVVIFTLLVTIISTALQVYNQYNIEVAQVDMTFAQIHDTYSRSLAQSLWNFDEEQTQLLLDGIRNMPDISYVRVTQEIDEPPIASGVPRSSNNADAEYQIFHPSENTLVGTLVIHANLDAINARIMDRIYSIFLTEGINTLIVACFMLYILDTLVIKHLRKLSTYTATLELGDIQQRDLVLDRKVTKYTQRDEFSQLVNSIKLMHNRINESFITIVEKEKELIAHKNHLEDLVTQRTKRIADLQEELVAAAHGAGMAEVASGVLHKMGNILNSAGVKSSDALDACRRIRTENLAKSVALILEYDGDYNHFFLEKNIGGKTLHYISMFIETSEKLVHRMNENLSGLSKDLDALQRVIKEQEKYINISPYSHLSNVSEIVTKVISSPAYESFVTGDVNVTPDLEFDPYKLSLILKQLLDHVQQSTAKILDSEQRIHVEVSCDHDLIVVTILDHGRGYTKDDLANIYSMSPHNSGQASNPFHDCANTIRQLNGTFDVSSAGLDFGATFVLKIPVPKASAIAG